MSVNKGIAPPNYLTEVGQVRATIGDTAFVEITPVEEGFGDYEMFSDGEIESFLATGGSFEGAVFYAYNSLATSAALKAKTVKDFDLSVDLTKRATELRGLATLWMGKAESATADIFETFDTVIEDYPTWPELAQRPVREWL